MAIQSTFARRKSEPVRELFPDGTEIPAWFSDTAQVDLSTLGRQYRITDYGIQGDGQVHTRQFQELIDRAASEGGGVIVVPPGIFETGAIFFRQGTHLHLQRGAVLRGSTDISDFPVMETRIEGQTCKYYPALVNADSIDGFTLTGHGVIDGHGQPFWKAFWQRRSWNPACTNKDEQRPRLLYVSNCRNVRIEGVTLQNSPFWTFHIYRSERVRLQHLAICNPPGGPSTDALDIDACSNVLVRACYMAVGDDAVALKGGKGPWADDPQRMPENGPNENIIIEDCKFGFCHSCLTCGSESIRDHNILLRRIHVGGAACLLHLKMRTDTPQLYEYITVEDIKGRADTFLQAMAWSQFADLQGRTSPPMSYASHVTMQRIELQCNRFFNVGDQPQYFHLNHFTLQDLDLQARDSTYQPERIDSLTMRRVRINDSLLDRQP
ncbi:MAG: exopolygalacturonase [Bacteroidaceae bacterium]|nr:exopolygalacturonase [Bacteroidaceae bacterium]